MGLKHSVASIMRRVPALHVLLIYLLNLVAARFTVGVNGVVFNRQGQVLLLEHVFRSNHPWGVPGGWVGRREEPRLALRRELLEEVGLAVSVGPPVLIKLSGPPGHLETAFVCEVEGEGLVGRLSGEVISTQWVDVQDLPDGLKDLDREMILQAHTMRVSAMTMQEQPGWA
jgi:8-oxo-dGTP pyrophosphatase MutT (NUDIX family)